MPKRIGEKGRPPTQNRNYTSKMVSSQKLTKHSSFPFSPSSFTMLCRNARFDSCDTRWSKTTSIYRKVNDYHTSYNSLPNRLRDPTLSSDSFPGISASEITCIVSSGALNSTHSLFQEFPREGRVRGSADTPRVLN